MCSGESTSSALTAIFSDILCEVLLAKSIVKVSSLLAEIRPMPQERWKT